MSRIEVYDGIFHGDPLEVQHDYKSFYINPVAYYSSRHTHIARPNGRVTLRYENFNYTEGDCHIKGRNKIKLLHKQIDYSSIQSGDEEDDL